MREAFSWLDLAMDAPGSGFALTGMNILLTAISVGMVEFILVSAGLAAGHQLQNEHWQGMAPLLTGLIFVAIAIIEYV